MEPTETSQGQKGVAQNRSGGPREQGEKRQQPEQRVTRTSGNFSPAAWVSSPLDTMMRLSRDMDQLMDSFLGGSRFAFPSQGRDRGSSLGTRELWQPRIDMRQKGDSLLIRADLPGIPRDAVKIETTDDGIAISGERQESREEGGANESYHFAERSYGSFYRVIPLPDGADADEARASMRDGVLEISVPFKQNTRRRQIQISE